MEGLSIRERELGGAGNFLCVSMSIDFTKNLSYSVISGRQQVCLSKR